METGSTQGTSFPWRSLSIFFVLLVLVTSMCILVTAQYDSALNPFQSDADPKVFGEQPGSDSELEQNNGHEAAIFTQESTAIRPQQKVSGRSRKPARAPDLKVGKFSWEIQPVYQNRETPGDSRKVILVKTHKTASTTLASIFLRMADMHNLRVYVPPVGTANPLMTVHPAKVPPPPPEYEPTTEVPNDPYADKRYDVWILHTQYRPVWLRRFVPGGLFVTSVRDPAERFVSEWFHLNGPKRSGYPTVREWVNAVEKTLNEGKNLTAELESMRNLLAKELTPFPIHQPLFLSSPIFQDVLRDIRDTRYMGLGQGKSDRKRPALRAILSEYFEEGVLAMAYEWGWPLSDVVYISQNNGSSTHYPKIPSQDPRNDEVLMRKLRDINDLDDVVYNVAKKAHMEKIQGLPKHWKKDLQKLRAANNAYRVYCRINPTSQYCRVAKSNPTTWLKVYRKYYGKNANVGGKFPFFKKKAGHINPSNK